ncbi:MAG TPA: hypothetical protein VK612_06010 [Pyrinomonadaceae bacterium]|nr:hypothetical protein [Pyrinomonadaceae bacterium]
MFRGCATVLRRNQSSGIAAKGVWRSTAKHSFAANRAAQPPESQKRRCAKSVVNEAETRIPSPKVTNKIA